MKRFAILFSFLTIFLSSCFLGNPLHDVEYKNNTDYDIDFSLNDEKYTVEKNSSITIPGRDSYIKLISNVPVNIHYTNFYLTEFKLKPEFITDYSIYNCSDVTITLFNNSKKIMNIQKNEKIKYNYTQYKNWSETPDPKLEFYYIPDPEKTEKYLIPHTVTYDNGVYYIILNFLLPKE